MPLRVGVVAQPVVRRALLLSADNALGVSLPRARGMQHLPELSLDKACCLPTVAWPGATGYAQGRKIVRSVVFFVPLPPPKLGGTRYTVHSTSRARVRARDKEGSLEIC